MRIINLSAGGDPFISLFTIRLLQERCNGEFDKIFVNYNNHSQVPQEVVSEFLSIVSKDKRIHIIYHPYGCGNGTPIKEGLLLADKDSLILLLEDDSFMFTPKVIDGWFKLIEENKTDMVGSPRYTYGEVADAAKKKYNLDYSGVGDKGFGLWPSFFTCKQSDLLKTNLDFGSTKYSKGEYFKELDHTFSETCYTDTFTWTSLQLRYMGLRLLEVPQYHADVYEIESKKKGVMNWVNGSPTHIHGGSLSAGWGGYLSGRLPDVSHDAAKQEIESRVAFWTICSDIVDGFTEFRKLYQIGILKLITDCKLDNFRIDKKINIYKNLMKI